MPEDDFFELGELTLEELIRWLENHPKTELQIGIENPHSWRGDYYQLGVAPVHGKSTTEKWLEVLKPTVGQTFQGYKGGDFRMHEDVDVFIAYEGYSNGQQVGYMLMGLLAGKP